MYVCVCELTVGPATGRNPGGLCVGMKKSEDPTRRKGL